MSTRARVSVAGALALAALCGMVAIVVHARSDNAASRPGILGFGATKPAAAPFAAFSEAQVALGDRCERVLVAATSAQRVQGLRGVRDLGPYSGMLFVNGSDAFARFTMAQTPLPLDIGWYTANGTPVGRARMIPCPRGTDASCPSYGPNDKYRYALETRAGGLGAGALSACGT